MAIVLVRMEYCEAVNLNGFNSAVMHPNLLMLEARLC